MGDREGERRARSVLLVIVLTLASVLPWIGQRRHLASREERHAEIARELVVRDAWVVPTLLFEEYRDKPPVLHNAAAMLFRCAGRPSYGLARLPSALAALGLALAVLGLARLVLPERAALFAALGAVGVQGTARMARVARPDMILGFAVVAAAFALARAGLAAGRARTWAWMALAGALAGLGVLTKGPYGLLFPLIFIAIAPWRAPERLRRPRGALAWLVFTLAMCAVLALWFVPAWRYDDGGFVRRVVFQPNLTTGSSHHARALWYYAGPILVALAPLTLLAPALVADVRRRGLGPMLASALAMLALLSLVPGKRVHYLVPALPFFVLAFAGALPEVARRRRWGTRAAWALLAVGLAAPPLYYGAIDPLLSPPRDARIALAEAVLAEVPRGVPIVTEGSIGDVIAFCGRRNDVRYIGRGAVATRRLGRRDRSLWVVCPERERARIEAIVPGMRLEPTEVAGALGRKRVRYRLYRRVFEGGGATPVRSSGEGALPAGD